MPSSDASMLRVWRQLVTVTWSERFCLWAMLLAGGAMISCGWPRAGDSWGWDNAASVVVGLVLAGGGTWSDWRRCSTLRRIGDALETKLKEQP